MKPSSNYTSPHVAAKTDDGSHEWEGLETYSNCTVYVEQAGAVVECSDDENRLEDSANGAGVRVHPGATNLVPSSCSSVGWSVARVTFDPAPGPCPDLDGFRCMESLDVAPDTHYFTRGGIAVADCTRYALRLYARSADRGLRVSCAVTSKTMVFWVDLATGSTWLATNFDSVSTRLVGDDWWEITAVFSTAVGDAGVSSWTFQLVNVDTYSYQGNGSSTVEIWGVQLEAVSAGGVCTPIIETHGAAASSLAPTVRCDGAQDRHLFNLARGVIRPRAHVIPLDAQASASTYPILMAVQLRGAYGCGWCLYLYVDTVAPFAAEWRIEFGPAPATVWTVASSWAWTPGSRYSVTLEGVVLDMTDPEKPASCYRIRVVDLDADTVVEEVYIGDNSFGPVDYSPTALLIGCSQLTDGGPLGHWNVIFEEIST